MRMWSNLALKLASLNALLRFLFMKRITKAWTRRMREKTPRAVPMS